jgi:DNA-binding FadR family transcriptional regulator
MPAEAALFRHVRRAHAADDVFDQLARAIVRGKLEPGAELPPERVLGERFGVSRVVARQAIHRLAEMGLVRLRQGGATIVLDPSAVRDLRVIELFFRLDDYSERDVRDINERQLLQGHVLLQVADLHADDAERAHIARIAESYIADGAPEAGLIAFEREFWTAIAEAGKNRIYVLEVGWWFRLLLERPHAHHKVLGPPHARALFMRELTRRLVAREDAPAFYLQIIRPALEAISAPTRNL